MSLFYITVFYISNIIDQILANQGFCRKKQSFEHDVATPVEQRIHNFTLGDFVAQVFCESDNRESDGLFKALFANHWFASLCSTSVSKRGESDGPLHQGCWP